MLSYGKILRINTKKAQRGVKYYTCYSCYRPLISRFMYNVYFILYHLEIYSREFFFIFRPASHKLNSVVERREKKNTDQIAHSQVIHSLHCVR